MDKRNLQKLHERGLLDSGTRLVNLRETIQDHTGLTVPRRSHEARSWWQDQEEEFINQLYDTEDEDEENESDKTQSESDQE